MSSKLDDMVFANLDQVALYTTKAIKRLVKTGSGSRMTGPKEEQLKNLIHVVETNLATLEADKNVYFATIRDYCRVFHDEWSQLEGRYNNLMLVVALRLGMEKVWIPDGCYPFIETEVSNIAACLYPNRRPVFAVKHLDQSGAMFDYLAKNSPMLESVYMPLSDNNNFTKCMKFKNLCVIELAGGVSDKVICNALWNVGNKKSHMILDLAISKDPKSWQLTLPHLRVLRNNVLKNETPMSAMRIALGAAALAIQPKMEKVESLLSWGTFEAVVHLLEMEIKNKGYSSDINFTSRSLQVTCLNIECREPINMTNIDRVVTVCPGLRSVEIRNPQLTERDIHLLERIVRDRELKELTLDAQSLSDSELTLLLMEMKSLETLTLRLSPQKIVDFNLPKPPAKLSEMDEKNFKRKSLMPHIKTLVLEFLDGGNNLDHLDIPELSSGIDGNIESIICFLSAFATTTDIYFRNTVLLHPSFLVYGCFGGAIAAMMNLRHISIISVDETVPRPSSAHFEEFYRNIAILPNMSHFREVQKLLPDLQEDVTFEHLEKLKSLEIDEFYVSPHFDRVIKALRLSGVHVEVLYRKGLRYV